jgi:hypothetical protein
MQKNFKIKIISAGALLLFAVILLIIYLKPMVDRPDSTTQEKIKTLVNEDELRKKIPNVIDSLFTQFGIKKEWIENSAGSDIEKQKKPAPGKNKDKNKVISPVNSNLWIAKKVMVPTDLSIAEVNIDINNFLRDHNCSLTASEDVKMNSVKSEIYFTRDSVKKLVGKILFIQSRELKRDASDICIILNKLENLSEQDLGKILSSTEKFSVILPDDIEKSDVQSKIFDARKDFLLLFDIGTEKEVDADFRSDMKSAEWKSKVKTLSNEFGKASAIILSPRRSIQRFESEVKDEFIKYCSNIFSDTVFVKFESREKPAKKISELINDITAKTNKGYKVIFYIINFSPEDLTEFTSQVYPLKKKGFRFKIFSDAIKKLKD